MSKQRQSVYVMNSTNLQNPPLIQTRVTFAILTPSKVTNHLLQIKKSGNSTMRVFYQLHSLLQNPFSPLNNLFVHSQLLGINNQTKLEDGSYLNWKYFCITRPIGAKWATYRSTSASCCTFLLPRLFVDLDSNLHKAPQLLICSVSLKFHRKFQF